MISPQDFPKSSHRAVTFRRFGSLGLGQSGLKVLHVRLQGITTTGNYHYYHFTVYLTAHPFLPQAMSSRTTPKQKLSINVQSFLHVAFLLLDSTGNTIKLLIFPPHCKVDEKINLFFDPKFIKKML